MKIIACLSFFDENPDLLKESISRVKELGVDILVAVDGPYDLYPTEKQTSGFQTVKAIIDQCGADGPDLILRNKTGWEGNEVEKRNYMLDLALAVAQEGDWFLVFDSDHMWEKIDSTDNLKRHLEHQWPVEYDVAEVTFAECAADQEEVQHWYEACLLYRAVRGMRYDGAHWRIRFPDGSVSTTLRTEQEKHTAKTIDLRSSFRVRHTVYSPELAERRERQSAWYDIRDSRELER